MNNNNKTTSGSAFVSLLTLIFIVLKLCKVIDWSWWWVLSPVWISAAFILIIVIIIIVVKTLNERE